MHVLIRFGSCTQLGSLPGPDGLETTAPPSFFRHPPGFEIRVVDPPGEGESPLRQPFWIRAGPFGHDPALHACLIAYLSDMAVVSSARAPGSPRDLARR